MNLITAIEISGNYPENILITASKEKEGNNWTSVMYLTRGGDIHKMMLSFGGFPFESEEEAILKMEEVAESAIDYIKETYPGRK